ncbi:uncharacterized protein [Procambarus clarkii]|uniref:uncharacterized protein isoform X2 n=1 Tax=Procambarus clarkii TaxID=6728 RepID=UPI001E6707A9|nr:uncharacterized protein LOC123759878 isoform X2 [Procambarus clarkii]
MMQSGLLLLLLTAVAGSATACKYWCKIPDSSSYECCDEGNHTHEDGSPSNCYYYCVYHGDVYCCADSSMPIPTSHDSHEGRCPEEEDQVCKSNGIFLVTKKAKVAKTSGSVQLVSGEPKRLPSCASDGYCAQDQKCCPSKCVRKHICMASLRKGVDRPNED